MDRVFGIKVRIAPYKITSKFGRSSIHVDDTDELLFKKPLDGLFLTLGQWLLAFDFDNLCQCQCRSDYSHFSFLRGIN